MKQAVIVAVLIGAVLVPWGTHAVVMGAIITACYVYYKKG